MKSRSLPLHRKLTNEIFLVASNLYRRFIKDLFEIAQQLNDCRRKEKEIDWLDSTTEALNALKTLLSKMVAPLVLDLPRPHGPYMIDTDASSYALEAVYFKHRNDKKLNKWARIGYWRRKLNKVEQNYLANGCDCLSYAIGHSVIAATHRRDVF